ncbi:helix-turn-helix transcriptional regulator [Azospirillum formosense]|uniref:helix-turn-helix domain-containing protein n=1 Tax=Azospirillum formosense TaxID=861533 RepID=UPI00338D9D3B
MSTHVNRSRLTSERRRRGWSQEHLAEASGISVRTVQRLERSGAATPASLMAMAAALALPFEALAASTGMARRVTPLTILPNIAPSLARYRSLRFALIETEDPGCVGLRAGPSQMILCSTAFMAGDFQSGSLAALEGWTIPYIWVESVDRAKDAYARLAELVTTRAGTREALVEDAGEWAILAETPA